MVKNIAIGTGRRKTAVARVFVREGSGKIVVNGKDVKEYFPLEEESNRQQAQNGGNANRNNQAKNNKIIEA